MTEYWTRNYSRNIRGERERVSKREVFISIHFILKIRYKNREWRLSVCLCNMARKTFSPYSTPTMTFITEMATLINNKSWHTMISLRRTKNGFILWSLRKKERVPFSMTKFEKRRWGDRVGW